MIEKRRFLVISDIILVLSEQNIRKIIALCSVEWKFIFFWKS